MPWKQCARTTCFASMSPEKQREIAARRRAAHEKGTAHEWTPDEARNADVRRSDQSRGRGRLMSSAAGDLTSIGGAPVSGAESRRGLKQSRGPTRLDSPVRGVHVRILCCGLLLAAVGVAPPRRRRPRPLAVPRPPAPNPNPGCRHFRRHGFVVCTDCRHAVEAQGVGAVVPCKLDERQG